MDGAARNGSFCGEGRLRAERPLAGGESISASHCGRHALRGPVSRPDVRAHRAALIEMMSARPTDGIGAKRALGGLPLASTGPAGPRGPVSASRIRGLDAVTGFTWGILPPLSASLSFKALEDRRPPAVPAPVRDLCGARRPRSEAVPDAQPHLMAVEARQVERPGLARRPPGDLEAPGERGPGLG